MMGKKMKWIALVLIVSLILPLSSFAADSNGLDPNRGLVNNVVNMEGQSKMTIHDVMLFPTNQGNQLVFKAEIYNAGNSELSFDYYWMRILTKQGTKHNVRMVNHEQSDVIVPKSKKTFIFTAIVDDSVKLSDISIQVIRWNFSVEGYEQLLGTVSISDVYNPTVTWDQGKLLTIDGSPVHIAGEKYQIATFGNNYDVRIELNLQNTGKFTVNVPNYTYYIQTEAGFVYPVSLVSQDVKVLPDSENQVSLQSTLPKTVDLTKLNMVLVEKIGDYHVPQLKIQLPQDSTVIEEEEVKEVYEYETKNGTYTMTFSNIQRLPNNETDIISIEVDVSNELNEKAIPSLNLIASLELDGIKLEPSEIEGIKLDNNLSIKKGYAIKYIFNTEIPFNFEFDEIRFNLSEKQTDTSLPIATFVREAVDLALPTTGIIRTGTVGKQSTIYVLNSEVYHGATKDIIYTDVIMTNEEPRFVTLEQLVAYYRINGNLYFPAKIPDNKVLTMPSGKAMIPITTEVPKGFEVNTIELVLGTQLNDTDMYKQAFLMNVPRRESVVSDTFEDIRIANYTLSMKDTKVYVNGGTASIRFDYTLSKDIYQHELAEHKARFTIVTGDKRYSQDVILGKDMEVGTGTFDVSISGADLLQNIQRYGYHIELSDAFDSGEKLKAASTKSRSWYSDSGQF